MPTLSCRPSFDRQVIQQLARVTLLTGATEDITSNAFTKQKAIAKNLLDTKHAIYYLCPLTAARDEAQRKYCKLAGLFPDDDSQLVVGMDLEWAGVPNP